LRERAKKKIEVPNELSRQNEQNTKRGTKVLVPELITRYGYQAAHSIGS
jgi:hypothetical protein